MTKKELKSELEEAKETIASYKESLELCLDSDSPLPPTAKECIRGFFITLV